MRQRQSDIAGSRFFNHFRGEFCGDIGDTIIRCFLLLLERHPARPFAIPLSRRCHRRKGFRRESGHCRSRCAVSFLCPLQLDAVRFRHRLPCRFSDSLTTPGTPQFAVPPLSSHPQSQRLSDFVDLAAIHPAPRPSQNLCPCVLAHPTERTEIFPFSKAPSIDHLFKFLRRAGFSMLRSRRYRSLVCDCDLR
jgi:hypothetical protein